VSGVKFGILGIKLVLLSCMIFGVGLVLDYIICDNEKHGLQRQDGNLPMRDMGMVSLFFFNGIASIKNMNYVSGFAFFFFAFIF